MAALAGKIGSNIGDTDAQKIFDELSQAILHDNQGDFARELKQIRSGLAAAEERLGTQVFTLHKAIGVRAKRNQLKTWWRLLGEYTFAGNSKDCHDLANSMYTSRDSGNGLSNMLTMIHDKLVLVNGGELAAYINTLHQDLSGRDERKDINTWYLNNIDQFLGAAFCIQLCGLALQIFMCSHLSKEEKEKDMESYKSRMWSNFSQQKMAAYSAMHPVVRQMRKDYDTPMNDGRLYIIEAFDGRGILFTDENSDLHIGPNEPNNDKSIWRFIMEGNLFKIRTANDLVLREHTYSRMAVDKRFLFGIKIKVGLDHDDSYSWEPNPNDDSIWWEFDRPCDLKLKIMPSNELTNKLRFVWPIREVGKCWEELHWLFETDFRLTTTGLSHLQPAGCEW